jgi:hypothetical protein
MLRTTRIFVLAASLVFFAGCDSSDPDGGLLDNYSAGQGGVLVSGGINANFTGTSFWSVVDDDDDGPMFILLVINGDLDDLDDSQFEGVILGGIGTRPGTGTYPLVGFEEEEQGSYEAIYVRSLGESMNFVFSETGTLTITGSTVQRVEGSFTFAGQVYSLFSPTDQTATVAGGFNAQFIDPDTIPGDGDFLEATAAKAMRQLAGK